MRLIRSALFLLPALAANAVLAQTPAGPEFVVNTYTTNIQRAPSLAADAQGRFVAVWESFGQDGSQGGIFGQRFDAAGGRLGAEFQVNAATQPNQFTPDVAIDRRGDFVVVWTNPEINARRFDRSGAPLGSDFQVNTYTTGTQLNPAVAVDAGGNFMVVWQSAGQDGNGLGIFARRFDANGVALGTDFQVNVYTTADQQSADVVALSDGQFVVVFQGPDALGQGIFARRYLASGNPVGADIPVSSALATQFAPSVAPLQPVGFVVAWTSYAQDGSHNGVYARAFDSTAMPWMGELRVNDFTTNAQAFPAVAANGTNAFVVTWESFLQDGSDAGVYGQRFRAGGVRVGAEFVVNAYTTGAQTSVALVTDSAGNFVTAWAGAGPDGSDLGVMARRFQGIVPTSLAVDTAGNGVLESAEVAAVMPSWRNTTDATQDFGGLLWGLSGPPTTTYVIEDDLADYGPTPSGTARSCVTAGDCYAVRVTTFARPLHMDATVTESLSGALAAQGLEKWWTLHVGDTFTDVPRSNPFYRFIETVIHHGVTSGCGGTNYCPDDPTSRAQMAVFVLVAQEGAGYAPPACTTPVFADVPASSPFCRWVEELARRGVVSGCGGGNFCPSEPVTREQMAVFVLRVQDPTFNPPACVPPTIYNDVPASSPFCRWIEELTRRGVVSGCGGGNYCPSAPVTRAQMAVFLVVTFGLSLYGP